MKSAIGTEGLKYPPNGWEIHRALGFWNDNRGWIFLQLTLGLCSLSKGVWKSR